MTETSEIKSPEEVEAIAKELKSKLEEFGVADANKKDSLLPELATYIIDNVTIETTEKLVDPETQTQLDNAVEKTFKTGLEDSFTGSVTDHPWKDGHSMVILGTDGKLLAARFVQAPQLAEYGDTTPYALVKALCEAYLHEVGRAGGLDNLDNLRHIIRDRGEGNPKLDFYEHVFTGSMSGQVDILGKKTYLADSGCVAEDQYVRDLLQLPEEAVLGTETLAGAFDSTFCSITRHYLENPGTLAKPIAEPDILQEIRARN